MKIKEVLDCINNWAPPGAAWSKDNVGLQIGSGQNKISNVFICLELTETALAQAIKKNCNLIITHHPLIFTPIKKINPATDTKSFLIQQLIKKDIALICAHTNLDFTIDGVSYQLAKKLGLNNISFLKYQSENCSKIVVYTPVNAVAKVSESIFNAGGGIIGNYENCSFNTVGTGTFKGNQNSNPNVGKKGNFEKVDEIKIEASVFNWNLDRVIKGIIDSHPYEEPAIDIYELNNVNKNYGYGAIGSLPEALSVEEFLALVANKLNNKSLKYCNTKLKQIKNVAVCGGSGSDLVGTAISRKADAYITADIKYHTYQDAENRILLIDAGHYETEVVVLSKLKQKITAAIKDKSVKVVKFNGSTNPVKTYLNIKEN